jgi:enoyl-CoA hydratase
MYQNIELAIDKGVAILTLNNPKKLNAISYQLLDELETVLGQIESDDSVKAIVLWGGETIFGAGANISEVGRIEKSYDAYCFSRRLQKLASRIENIPKATIAAIGGLALGGCLEFALSCDLRIASKNAQLGLPEINLGTLPGAGGTQRLPRLIGISRAKEMLLIGENVSAEEAYRLGIINRIVPAGTLLEAAKKLAEKLAKKPPIALTMIKSAVNIGINLDLERAFEHEAKCFAVLFNTDDLREGVKAFIEKRPADFTGK